MLNFVNFLKFILLYFIASLYIYHYLGKSFYTRWYKISKVLLLPSRCIVLHKISKNLTYIIFRSFQMFIIHLSFSIKVLCVSIFLYKDYTLTRKSSASQKILPVSLFLGLVLFNISSFLGNSNKYIVIIEKKTYLT